MTGLATHYVGKDNDMGENGECKTSSVLHILYSVSAKRTRSLTSGIITSQSYSTCLHLVGLNLRALLAKVDRVETAHLSGKLLGLLGSSVATDNSVL